MKNKNKAFLIERCRRQKLKIICINLIILLLLGGAGVYSQNNSLMLNGAYLTLNGGTPATPVYLVVNQPNALGITRTSGLILSENEYNRVKWKIRTGTGNFVFPLGVGTTYIPFKLNITAAGTESATGSFTIASWYTNSNATIPAGTTISDADCPLNAPNENNVTDRFWVITPEGYSTNPTADASFYYNATELDGIGETELQMQRWNSASSSPCKWDLPVGTVNTTDDYVLVSGISNFSPWTMVKGSAPLPVELLEFTAQWKNKAQTAALLKWITATEINNDYFNIERSKDGLVFEKIATVKGAGNSSTIRTYEFIDHLELGTWDLELGIFYYCLKQVDYDGKYSYSDLVTLSRENNLNIISVFPNPANDFVNVLLSSSEASNAEITIINTLSQTILNQKVTMQKGLNKYLFNVSPLAKGIYTIKVSQNNHIAIYKLVIN